MQLQQARAPDDLRKARMRWSVASLPQSTETRERSPACAGRRGLQVRRIGNADDTEKREVFYLPKILAHARILGLQLAAVSWRPKSIARAWLDTLFKRRRQDAAVAGVNQEQVLDGRRDQPSFPRARTFAFACN